MKKEALLLISFLLISVVSAVSIPIYVKPLSADGSLNANTAYVYTFNWTTDNSCNNVVFSNSSITITTGNDGIGFANLTLPDDLTSMPDYLCEYRAGTLRKVHSFSGQFFNKVYTQNISATNILNNSQSGITFWDLIVPAIDNSFDLGSPLLRFRDLWIGRNANITGNLTVDTNTLFVDSDNNRVGIGTITPQQELNVVGDFNVTGTSYFTNTSFNGGWLNDGVSIIDGDIYAQVGYFYNITSLNVTKQNLTVIDNLNLLGNLTLREKITFTLGEIIDNIVDGWITITGGLNVTKNIQVNGNITISGTNDVVFWNNGTHLIID